MCVASQSVGSEALKHTSAFTDTSLVQDGQQDTALQLPLLVARAHAQTADSLAADAESLKVVAVLQSMRYCAPRLSSRINLSW